MPTATQKKGVADQFVSSVSNFVLGLFVARSFGRSIVRSRSTLSPTRWSSTPRGGLGEVPIRSSSGIAAGLVVAGVVRRRRLGSRPLPWVVRGRWLVSQWQDCSCLIRSVLSLIALGIGLPGLALQDSSTVSRLACKGSATFLNDLSGPGCSFASLSYCTAGATARPTVCSLSAQPQRSLLCFGMVPGPHAATAVPRGGMASVRTAQLVGSFTSRSRTSASAVHHDCVPLWWARWPALPLWVTFGRPKF